MAHNNFSIPGSFRHLFWDADITALDRDAHTSYIIERVLNLGDESAVSWLFGVYSADEVRQAVCCSRRLDRKTASCWQNVFDLECGDMRCFGTYLMNPDGYF